LLFLIYNHNKGELVNKIKLSPTNKSSLQRRYITSDAQSALERLVVGRECNNFDTFSSARKASAYLVLLKLGLISATVKDVPDQSYPEVTIHSVTSLGKKTYENQTNYKEKTSAKIPQILVAITLVGIAVIIVLKFFKII
jgi:hypothetical protein